MHFEKYKMKDFAQNIFNLYFFACMENVFTYICPMPLYGAHIPRQQEYPPPAFLPQCQPVNSSYLSISHIQGVQFLSYYITYYGLTTHVLKQKVHVPHRSPEQHCPTLTQQLTHFARLIPTRYTPTHPTHPSVIFS